MPSVSVNYWAVLVAAIVNMAVGSVWYSKAGFGNVWSKLVGKKLEDMRKNAGPGYAISMVGALVQAYILVHFVRYTGALTWWEGVKAAFWLWVGFVAFTQAVNTVFAGRSWKLWKIDAGYFLVVLLANGAILAAWR